MVDIQLLKENISEFLTFTEKLGQRETIEAFGQSTLDFTTAYIQNVRVMGFSVAFVEDMLMLFVTLRFIVLLFRYNLITSFAIAAISLISSYFWYVMLLQTIKTYENALYLNPYTARLGIDSIQLSMIQEAQINSPDFALRLTNPGGIIFHAINHGTMRSNYRIDAFSLMVSAVCKRLEEGVGVQRQIAAHRIETYYHLFYRIIGPFTMRLLVNQYHANTSYLAYSLIVRINKTQCPYLIRWHWTFCLISKFFNPYMYDFLYRMGYYMDTALESREQYLLKYNFSTVKLQLEIDIFTWIIYTIIITYLVFIIYAMFHAILGQYFYIPFFTENVELHLGPRVKSDIYSGGCTAWQDEDEQPNWILPKLWYGWFGRGTKSPNIIVVLIRRLVYRPVYTIVRNMINAIRNFFRREY